MSLDPLTMNPANLAIRQRDTRAAAAGIKTGVTVIKTVARAAGAGAMRWLRFGSWMAKWSPWIIGGVAAASILSKLFGRRKK